MRRIGLGLGLASIVMACGTSPSSSQPAAEPSPSAVVRTGLPPGCELIELRSPTGERVDLTGEWAGDGKWVSSASAERTWLIQVGDCVWGSVVDDNFMGQAPGAALAVLTGHLSRNFTVDVAVVVLSQAFAQFPSSRTYGTVQLLVEFDADGQVQLREDRRPGEVTNRCTGAPCMDPLLLQQVPNSLRPIGGD